MLAHQSVTNQGTRKEPSSVLFSEASADQQYTGLRLMRRPYVFSASVSGKITMYLVHLSVVKNNSDFLSPFLGHFWCRFGVLWGFWWVVVGCGRGLASGTHSSNPESADFRPCLARFHFFLQIEFSASVSATRGNIEIHVKSQKQPSNVGDIREY